MGAELRRQVLRRVAALPAMPQVLQRARHKAENPLVGARELAAILETDAALTARILKLANSAYYGFSGRIATVNQAALLLGVQTLMATILLVGMAGILGERLKGYRLPSGALWRHSLAVAIAARRLALAVSPSLEEEAFSAGLLHDAGKLVLDPYLAERNEEWSRLPGEEEWTWCQVERALLGFDHAMVAADICRAWRIPARQALAIGLHHRPLQAVAEDRPLAALLNVGNALASSVGLGLERPSPDPDPETLQLLNLHGEILREIREGLPAAVSAITESCG